MKKWIILLFILTCHVVHSYEWAAELRGGYFNPRSNLLRRVYYDGGFEGEGEGTFRFCNNWQLFGNVSGFFRNGHSLGTGTKTYIRIIPISLGARYILTWWDCFEPYAGAGVAYTILRSRNNTGESLSHFTKEGFGVVLKSGFYYHLNCHWYLDFYLDYQFQKMHFKGDPISDRFSINVSGLRTGLGIGYTF